MQQQLQGRPAADVGEFVRQALAHYALSKPAAHFVAESFNTVYRVRAAEGHFAFRVSPARGIHEQGAVDAEEYFTERLHLAGVHVPRLVRTVDDRLTVRCSAAARWIGSMLTWRHGVEPRMPPTSHTVTGLGDLSARLHRASPPSAHRRVGALDARDPRLFAVPHALGTAPPAHRDVLLRTSERVSRWLEELWRSADEPPRLLHMDLTPRNVVIEAEGSMTPIDFQDIAWGHRVQDIANSLYGLTRGEFSPRVLNQFRAGYERTADWPRAGAQELRRLFVARRIAMVNLSLFLRRDGWEAYVARHCAALSRDDDG